MAISKGVDRFYVYIHRKETGEPFYVGKGTGYRAYDKTRRNAYWNRVFKKYGLIVEIYAEHLKEDVAFSIEKQLILDFKNSGIKLCNMTGGGEGSSGVIPSIETRKKLSSSLIGRKHTEETKRLLSIVAKKRFEDPIYKERNSILLKSLATHESKERSSKWSKALWESDEFRKYQVEINTGKSLSEDIKQKISKSLIGRKFSESHKQKLSSSASREVIDLSSGVVFSSAKEAASCFNLNHSTLCSKLRGRKKNNTNLRYVIYD